MTATDQPDQPALVTAQPFEARQCPECKLWIFTAAGPFAEDDPTKTEADWLHWEAEHLPDDPAAREAVTIGFPFFSYNEEPVEASMAYADPTARIASLAQQTAEALVELMNLLTLSTTEATAFGRVTGVCIRLGANVEILS